MASDYTSPKYEHRSDWLLEVQAVNVTPMSDGQHENQQLCFFNRVQQPIGADSNSKHVVWSDHASGGRGKGIEAEGLARTNQTFAIGIVYSA
jgi:hypothetical protein